MPSFVNIGAYVDSGTMVDTWATVGSCAQIGKNVHLSGGVGIGGVLEPLQASPVIIEDNSFLGSRSIVVEGVRVENEAVLGANVVLTASTKIIDVTGSKPVYLKGYVPKKSVVIPGTNGKYSATNNKPLYEGAINGSFIDPITKNKLSVNYIAFNLGLIKPDGVKVSLLDDQNNEISCAVTTAECSQIISFASKLPIQRFKISPNTEVNSTLAIADIWFSKPKHKFPLLIERQKQIELTNGDIIICNDFNLTNNLFDPSSKTKLYPNSNFSGEITVQNKNLRSIAVSYTHLTLPTNREV